MVEIGDRWSISSPRMAGCDLADVTGPRDDPSPAAVATMHAYVHIMAMIPFAGPLYCTSSSGAPGVHGKSKHTTCRRDTCRDVKTFAKKKRRKTTTTNGASRFLPVQAEHLCTQHTQYEGRCPIADGAFFVPNGGQFQMPKIFLHSPADSPPPGPRMVSIDRGNVGNFAEIKPGTIFTVEFNGKSSSREGGNSTRLDFRKIFHISPIDKDHSEGNWWRDANDISISNCPPLGAENASSTIRHRPS